MSARQQRNLAHDRAREVSRAAAVHILAVSMSIEDARDINDGERNKSVA